MAESKPAFDLSSAQPVQADAGFDLSTAQSENPYPKDAPYQPPGMMESAAKALDPKNSLAYGIGEGALKLGASSAASLLKSLRAAYGLVTAPKSASPTAHPALYSANQGARAVDAATPFQQPTSPYGQAIGSVMDKAGQLASQVGTGAGNWVQNQTGSPGLGATADLATQALPVLAGARYASAARAPPVMGDAQAATLAARNVNRGLGLDWNSLSSGVQSKLTALAARGVDFSGLDPAALARQSRLDQLGIPYTRGDVTRDAAQVTREETLSKAQDAGQPIREVRAAQDAALHNSIDILRKGTGAQATTREGLGVSVQDDALRAKEAVSKANYQALYKTAEQTQPDATVSPQPMLNLLTQSPEIQHLGFMSSWLKRAGIAAKDEDGNVTALRDLNLKELNDLRTKATGIAASGGTDGYYARQAVNAIDQTMQGVPDAAAAWKAAINAFKAHKIEFEDQGAVEKLVGDKTRTDRQTALANTFDSFIGGDANGIRQIRKSLTTGGNAETQAAGAQAWKDLQGATLDYLRQKAIGKRGIEGDTSTQAGQDAFAEGKPLYQFNSSFRDAYAELKADGKIDAIFSPEQVRQLDRIYAAVGDVRTRPPARISGSPTAANATAMMEDFAKNHGLAAVLDNIPWVGKYGAAAIRGLQRTLQQQRDLASAATTPLNERAAQATAEARRQAVRDQILQYGAPSAVSGMETRQPPDQGFAEGGQVRPGALRRMEAAGEANFSALDQNGNSAFLGIPQALKDPRMLALALNDPTMAMGAMRVGRGAPMKTHVKLIEDSMGLPATIAGLGSGLANLVTHGNAHLPSDMNPLSQLLSWSARHSDKGSDIEDAVRRERGIPDAENWKERLQDLSGNVLTQLPLFALGAEGDTAASGLKELIDPIKTIGEYFTPTIPAHPKAYIQGIVGGEMVNEGANGLMKAMAGSKAPPVDTAALQQDSSLAGQTPFAKGGFVHEPGVRLAALMHRSLSRPGRDSDANLPKQRRKGTPDPNGLFQRLEYLHAQTRSKSPGASGTHFAGAPIHHVAHLMSLAAKMNVDADHLHRTVTDGMQKPKGYAKGGLVLAELAHEFREIPKNAIARSQEFLARHMNNAVKISPDAAEVAASPETLRRVAEIGKPGQPLPLTGAVKQADDPDKADALAVQGQPLTAENQGPVLDAIESILGHPYQIEPTAKGFNIHGQPGIGPLISKLKKAIEPILGSHEIIPAVSEASMNLDISPLLRHTDTGLLDGLRLRVAPYLRSDDEGLSPSDATAAMGQYKQQDQDQPGYAKGGAALRELAAQFERPKLLMQHSWESNPGATALHNPELRSSPEALDAFHRQMESVLLDPGRRDRLIAAIGNPGQAPAISAPGVYGGQVSPGTQSRSAVSVGAAGLFPADAARVKATEMIRAYGLGQDAAAGHVALPVEDPAKADTFSVVMGPKFNAKTGPHIMNALDSIFGPGNSTPVATAKGFNVLNLGDENFAGKADALKQALTPIVGPHDIVPARRAESSMYEELPWAQRGATRAMLDSLKSESAPYLEQAADSPVTRALMGQIAGLNEQPGLTPNPRLQNALKTWAGQGLQGLRELELQGLAPAALVGGLGLAAAQPPAGAAPGT